MNESFRLNDYVKTKLHGNGTIIDNYISKGSRRVYAYKIKLDDKSAQGLLTIDAFPYELGHVEE